MSKTHTIRVKITAGADAEVYVCPSKRAAEVFAHDRIKSVTKEGCIEIFAGDYVADRRVVDGTPVVTLKVSDFDALWGS